MLAVIALAGTGLVEPSGADEPQDTFYLVDVTGHPFEPYAQLPEEVNPGIPSTYIELQKDPLPVRCEVVSGVYDTGFVVEGVGAVVSEGRYVNPTKAWAVNPEDSRPTKAEKTTFPNGPSSYAECGTTEAGIGKATFGRYLSEEFSFESASSDSTNTRVQGEDTILSETVNKVHGVKAGPLSIGVVMSWIKVESKPNAKPVVSYQIELTGIRNSEQVGGAVGEQGILLGGQAVAGPDLAKQFNAQVNSQQKAFETLGQYGLTIVKPRFGIAHSGRYVFEIAALDGLIGAAARKNALGHGFGFRMGVGRVASKYGIYGNPATPGGYSDEVEDPRTGV